MEYAAAVRVGDGVTHVDEPAEQLAQSERPLRGKAAGDVGLVKAVDGLLQAVASDEAHGVEGASVGVGAQAVDRHDARMLQAAGDLRLAEEAGLVGRAPRPT